MRRGKPKADPTIEEARQKADETLRKMEQLERELDQEDDEDGDPWVRALGLEAPPWKPEGED